MSVRSFPVRSFPTVELDFIMISLIFIHVCAASHATLTSRLMVADPDVTLFAVV